MSISKKILKKFFTFLDYDRDIEEFLYDFSEPQTHKELQEYADIISDIRNLKNIRADDKFENYALKNIYSRVRIDDADIQKKISKKDMLLIRFRPTYLKPLAIFVSVFIFVSLSFVGTIYASEKSLPGETLYPVKRTTESIQIALTPYKYENDLYLKILDSRLNEAEIILNQTDFIDIVIVEELITDIDDTYERCLSRKYFDMNQNGQVQMRIRGIKEVFKRKCNMLKNSSSYPNQNFKDSNDTNTGKNENSSFSNSEKTQQNNKQNQNKKRDG